MTTTLTLEVDEDVLARAEARSKARGVDLRSELVSKLEELGSGASRQRDAVERMLSRANAHPHVLDGSMPNREERNARR